MQKEIIAKTQKYVKKALEKESTGHDIWHIERVRENAILIGRKEKADLFVVQLAALLHDLADHKFTKTQSSAPARIWLTKLKVDKHVVDHVCQIIDTMSFKGSKFIVKMKTIEGKVVHDADKLDTVGAIGIARTIATGASLKRPIYNPSVPLTDRTRHYRWSPGHSSIHHFYDKLLLLKGRMNTKTGKMLAEKRHEFLKAYLEQFFKEWDGKA
jgi:uncharacterized protein